MLYPFSKSVRMLCMKWPEGDSLRFTQAVKPLILVRKDIVTSKRSTVMWSLIYHQMIIWQLCLKISRIRIHLHNSSYKISIKVCSPRLKWFTKFPLSLRSFGVLRHPHTVRLIFACSMSSESSQLVLNVIIHENKARNKREVRGRPSKSSEQFSCVIFKILKWIKDDDLEINANFCLLAT